MRCDEASRVIEAAADSALAPAESAAFGAHVATCPSCAQGYAEARRLKSLLRTQATRHAAPDALRRAVFVNLVQDQHEESQHGPVVAAPARRRALLAAAGAFASGVATTLLVQWWGASRPPETMATIVADHLGHLQDDRLVTLAATDGHKVKPWLTRNAGLGVPVPDLSAAGFTLIGGRVLEGPPRAAVVVYRIREHVVAAFVMPSAGPLDVATRLKGINVVPVALGDLVAFAVSDVNERDLRRFVQLYSAGS